MRGDLGDDLTDTLPEAIANKLLSRLPDADLKRLRGNLNFVDLPLRQVLQTPDVRIEHCYFIETGVVSMVAVLEDGAPVEIGVVGNEGVVGLPVIIGAAKAPSLGIVQLAGTAWRIPASVLREEFETSAAMRRVLLLHMQAMHTQVAQTAACNTRHDSEQRLARWLLMAQERYGRTALPLTQEFLSTMLGIRRQQVSIAAAALQKAGLIRYRHGMIELLDVPALREVACECYGLVAAETERLLQLT